MPTRTERFKSLCKANKVKAKQETLRDSHSDPLKRIVWTDLTRLEETPVYSAALHEVGHVVTWPDHVLINADSISDGVDSAILENEAAAHQWAIDNAGETPDADFWWNVHYALGSYLQGFKDTYGRDGAKDMLSYLFDGRPELKKRIPEMCRIPESYSSLLAEAATKSKGSKLTPEAVFPNKDDRDSIG